MFLNRKGKPAERPGRKAASLRFHYDRPAAYPFPPEFIGLF